MKRFLNNMHRITGSIMSLLFLMWCISGIILLFRGFPHASLQKRFNNIEFLVERDFIRLPHFDEIKSGKIELEKYQGNLVYRKYKSRKKQIIYDAHTLERYNLFSKDDAIKEAEHYINADVVKVDSITKLNSWIPWGHYKPLLPFYKCYMADEKHSVIFISAKTGTVVQHTNRYSRWMARLGAIPHLMYFPQIKQHAELWKYTILTLSLIGILTILSGMYISFFRFKRNKSGKIIGLTVYKKRSYKWHHIFGLFIGIFLLTFLLSGIFYATGVPSWISEKNKGESPHKIWNQRISYKSAMHPERIWELIPNKTGLRKIAWSSSMGFPIVEAYYDNYKKPLSYITNNDTFIEFSTTKEKIEDYAIEILANKNFSIEKQEKFDNYYKSSGMYYHSLPVYKLSINDKFKTTLYIDPESGKAIERFDRNKRARRWLTRGLHKINFSCFNNLEWLRKTILIILCLGGVVVSTTGLLLSLKWLKRKLKKREKAIKNN